MNVFTNSMFPVSNGRTLTGHVKQFIEDGRKSGALAEKERGYGEVARAESLRGDETDPMLAEIARWHYAQSVRFYREALGAFELAARIELPDRYQKYVGLKIKRYREEIAFAGGRIDELDTILKSLSTSIDAG